MLDLLAEAMVEAIYEGKAKGYMLDAYPMNLEQVTQSARTVQEE